MKLRTILLILSFLAVFSATAGGYFYYAAMNKSAIKEARQQIEYRSKAIKNLVSFFMANDLKAVKAMAMHTELVEALLKPDSIGRHGANSVLDLFQQSLEANVAYLMDREGSTIASSNRDDALSFVGKNYSFRPYFQQALNGRPAIYMALGVTSGKRGIYYSHPVLQKDQNKPIGVAVVKIPIQKIQNEFFRPDGLIKMVTLMTGPHGVVFMSNNEQLLFRTLWQTSNEKRIEIAESKQFGKGPWEWAGYEKKDNNRVFDKSGNEYLMFQTGIELLPGWDIVLLYSFKEILNVFKTPFSSTLGYIIMALFILICPAVLILYRIGKSDIIKRLETEAKLQESEERFRHIFEQAATGVALTDTKTGHLIKVNKKYCDIVGRTQEELSATNFMDITHPDDLQTDLDHMQRLSKGEISNYSIEKRFIRKDGSVVWGNLTVSSLQDIEPLRVCHIAMLEDITRRKEAKAALLESLSLLDSTLESTADGIVVVDRKGRISTFNKKFIELWCFPEDILESKDYKRAFDFALEQMKDSDRFLEQVQELDNQPEKEAFDILKLKDGKIFEWFSIPQKSEDSTVGRVWNFRDVTYRKLIEEEIKKAKEHAENANRTKSGFLANMSHEIRTPLNSVIGFLELVLESPLLNDQHRKHLETAKGSANNLLRVINDILDISKLENGKLAIELQPFSISQLMHDIQSNMNIQADENGIYLKIDIHPSVAGRYIGDPLRLKQILTNLVNNAIKFTVKGGVYIRVLPTDEGQMHFIVEDTGIGIPPNQLNQIFGRFTQAEISTTRRYGGTGLGTSIALELVELMGGSIRAESEEGKGSKFHFTIPLSASDHIPESDDLPAIPVETSLTNINCNFRILLAEDVEANVDLARIRLEQQNHEVTVAWSGIEAVEAFKKTRFDVILMDIQMPGMGGLEATRRIRAIEGGTDRHVPIIAITAAVMQEEKEKYLKSGIDAVVAKPVNFKTLFKIMDSLIPRDVGKKAGNGEEDAGTPPEFELPLLDGVDIKKEIDTVHLEKLFTEMTAAFDQYSPVAIEPFLSELEAYFLKKQLSHIKRAMERFDFDKARQKTIELAKTLEIDMEKHNGR